MLKTLNIARIALVSAGTFFALLAVSSGMAHAAVTSPMAIGSSGNNVTQLQQFLATNPTIYPAGIVSGYYGPLTAAAVTQLQVAYGIAQVGQVGPITAAKINNIMATGFGLDTSAPMISGLSISQVNPTSVTINWTTSALARGQVFYATSPIEADEATGVYQLPYIGGTPASVNSNTSVSNNQSVQLSNLQPNTYYYFFARAIDNSGNVSMSMPQSFQTN